MVTKPATQTIPDSPGSYQFLDEYGRVIYVGKAKSLRSRVSSYFTNRRNLHLRTIQMLDTATQVEWIQVDNDFEAIMLEYNLIKKHKPRFNVRLIDDKSYPFLAVTVSDEWPRPRVMRGKRNKKNKYYGPYAHAYAIRTTLDLLLKIFPLRSCSDAKLKRHQKIQKPCLLFHIDKCSGPCINAISKEDYQKLVDGMCSFLEGKTENVVSELNSEMLKAAENLNFERAAKLRDRLEAIEQSNEKQLMISSSQENIDVIGLFRDQLEAVGYVLFIRNGKVVGRQKFIIDLVEDLSQAELIETLIEGIYAELDIEAKLVLVPETPEDLELYEDWLSESAGTRVQIRQPKRGDKVTLLNLAEKNAEEEFQRNRVKRSADYNTRSQALNELQKWLDLPQAPLRIECYDMSHLQGTNYVGSMVVAEDGLMKNSEYRRFQVKDVTQNDDYAAMREVLTRRFNSYIKDRSKPVEERGKFQYPPNLVVVDGGKGQLGVAYEVLTELNLLDQISLCSLAKRLEEVFVPDRKEPIIIPRQSKALYLLQRLRDESHRFAIEYHRKLRNKEMTQSVLDDIKGLGNTRKQRLIKEFGGINKIKSASLEQLKEISWLPDSVAENIYNHFH